MAQKNIKTEYFFKCLTPNRNGGYVDFKYPKLLQWTPSVTGTLELCRNGYHVCRPRDVWHWLRPDQVGIDRLFLAEAEVGHDGTDKIEGTTKVVVRRLRLIRQLPVMKYASMISKIYYAHHYMIRGFLPFDSLDSVSYNLHYLTDEECLKIIMKELLTKWGIKALW